MENSSKHKDDLPLTMCSWTNLALMCIFGQCTVKVCHHLINKWLHNHTQSSMLIKQSIITFDIFFQWFILVVILFPIEWKGGGRVGEGGKQHNKSRRWVYQRRIHLKQHTKSTVFEFVLNDFHWTWNQARNVQLFKNVNEQSKVTCILFLSLQLQSLCTLLWSSTHDWKKNHFWAFRN